MGWISVPKIPVTYLEAMEESKHESKEPDEAGNAHWKAYRNGNSRKGYWAMAESGNLPHTITNKRLAAPGSFEILSRCESVRLWN